MIMEAMILAAGRGERLRPITDTIPKPLVPMGERTLIEHHLVRLSAAGVRHVVINVAYLGEKIMQFLGDGSRFDLKLSYSIESNGALGTAGGIINALDRFKEEQFLVINSDIFTDCDFSQIQLPDSSKAHLVLAPNPAHNLNGDYCLTDDDGDGMVQHPSNPAQTTFTFTGIGLYRKTMFEALDIEKCGLTQVFDQPIRNGEISGQLHRTLWIDVGNAERLAQARTRS